MSIQLPGLAVDAFNLVGLPWPGIDEDQLRAWAESLRAHAAEITALAGSSRSAVAALAASNDSSFALTLAARWQDHDTLISDLRVPMETFAGALDVAADAVEAQKIVVIGAAVALAGEVIATQGEALFTFGLAEAEVPAEVAIARLAVKAALQELEGQLLGMLINKAASGISALVGGTIGKLVAGGGQVVAETVTLTADYHAMSTLSTSLSGHADRVDQASTASWRKAGIGTLEEGGPGGGWREVARAVEQAVLHVLRQLFIDLGRGLWAIIKDTIDFLKKAITALRHTDDTLVADAKNAVPDTKGSLMAIGTADAGTHASPADGADDPEPGARAAGQLRPPPGFGGRLESISADLRPGHADIEARYANDYKSPEAPPPRIDGAHTSPEKWVHAINPGEPERERLQNCGSCARAVDNTWHGHATVAAEMRVGVFGEHSSRMTEWCMRPPETTSMTDIRQQLTELGPGSSAIIVTGWWGNSNSSHWFNAVNDAGTVKAVDGQSGKVEPWPPSRRGLGYDERDMWGDTLAHFFGPDGKAPGN